MDLIAINFGNWFSKKIEDFKKESDILKCILLQFIP